MNQLQMEEAKAEVEKKVSLLIKSILNKNKIPKVTKKELVGIVNDLHDQCQLLYSAFDVLGTYGRNASSSSSSSDLDYYSSEETEISSSKVSGETWSSDYGVMLRKLQETELENEDLKRQLSNLKQEADFRAVDVEGKSNEDREYLKSLMMKEEAALLLSQKKELESQLEKKTIQVSETQMRLKRVEEETEKRAKAEMKIIEEKEALWNKVQKLEVSVDTLRKQRKGFSENMKGKISEIDLLREENQKLLTRIAEIDETEDQLSKLVKEQEDVIYRLSMEMKDQKKLLGEQKNIIDKFSEDQKLMKHVAEQIHSESKTKYFKTQDKTKENKGDLTVSETELKQMKEMVEQGFAGPEMAIKKLEESGNLVKRVTRLAKEIDSARKWVKEKDNKMKHEVETLEAKLECREAQESLLKEKLSKLEAKLGEEATGKMSLKKAMKKIKKLEIDVKEKEYELLSLGEGKREAIRQLSVVVDYQRCRYDDLKTSIFKVALQA